MKEFIRGAITFILMAAAVCAGLYFGVWWAFIGGIIAVIEGAKATPVESMTIALGIARVMFAGLIGWAAFWVGAAAAGFVNLIMGGK